MGDVYVSKRGFEWDVPSLRDFIDWLEENDNHILLYLACE